jgi:hypothetical protein
LLQSKSSIEGCSKHIININNGISNLSLNGPEYLDQSNKCIMEDDYEDELGF